MNSVSFNEIFFPHHNRQLKRIKDEQVNFVHYTNAETAFKIIKNQEIWLRNVAVMNDFREFEHGKECLVNLLDDSEEGQALKNIFNVINPDIFDKVYSDFKNCGPFIKDDFYISCFSEHKNKDNDIGKLSMWRAYGGNSGVAIVFKQDFFSEIYTNYGLDFSSVAYLNQDELKQEINHLAITISSNIEQIKSLSTKDLSFYLFNIFRFSALCNKHIGFDEEKEWRLIAIASQNIKNDLISQEIETISGIPQNILKVRLKGIALDNLVFKDMIHKVIIGPCLYPWIIRNSIATALQDIGITDPENIIHISNIPLRVNSN